MVEKAALSPFHRVPGAVKAVILMLLWFSLLLLLLLFVLWLLSYFSSRCFRIRQKTVGQRVNSINDIFVQHKTGEIGKGCFQPTKLAEDKRKRMDRFRERERASEIGREREKERKSERKRPGEEKLEGRARNKCVHQIKNNPRETGKKKLLYE